ncbi:MAG: oxygenase MpaB family protein [Chitinophagaceae bacterium]
MDFFVEKGSIVRQIWGKGDTILFIFAGSAAEFALNKAVDWLYYTGRLPADPLGRLFSTVNYAREIVFSEKMAAGKAIDKITAIHSAVENARGTTIPDWAYRDVLFMLIYYSIASFELLERKLTESEKNDVYEVFKRMGNRMGIHDLPETYVGWLPVRARHIEEDLQRSKYTIHLYQQYKKHLGQIRFFLLKKAQVLVVPQHVKDLLQLGNTSFLKPVVPLYKLSRKLKLDWLIKSVLLPSRYKTQFKALDVVPV